jgi:hypothetical protein
MRLYVQLFACLTCPLLLTAQLQLSFSVDQDPSLIAEAGPDKTTPSNQPVIIGGSPTASGGSGQYTFEWFPAESLNDASLANPTATPEVTTTYYLFVNDRNSCQRVDSMTVVVGQGEGFQLGRCLITEANWPTDAATIVDARPTDGTAGEGIVGLLTGQRIDGKPGIWTVDENCVIAPLRQNIGFASSELPNGPFTKTPYATGWRLEVNGFSEDGTRILGTAINEEGYGGSPPGCRNNTLTIAAGTSLPVSWALSFSTFRKPDDRSPFIYRYLWMLLQRRGIVEGDQVTVATVGLRYGCRLDYVRCGYRLYALGCRGQISFRSPPTLQSRPDAPLSGTAAFPNPTSGLLTLQTSRTLGAGTVTVTNEVGQLVRSIPTRERSTLDIDLTGEPAGLYIIHVQTSEDSEVLKVLKQ